MKNEINVENIVVKKKEKPNQKKKQEKMVSQRRQISKDSKCQTYHLLGS